MPSFTDIHDNTCNICGRACAARCLRHAGANSQKRCVMKPMYSKHARTLQFENVHDRWRAGRRQREGPRSASRDLSACLCAPSTAASCRGDDDPGFACVRECVRKRRNAQERARKSSCACARARECVCLCVCCVPMQLAALANASIKRPIVRAERALGSEHQEP